MIVLLAAAVSAASPAAPASEAQQLACYRRAFSQAHGQLRANVCARDAYNRAERAMQAQWTQLLGVVKHDAPQTRQLDFSQQVWIKYRLAWCSAAAREKRGQDDWEQIHSGCLAELTRQRTKELENLLLGDGY